jgi:hypothetical protein
MKRKLAITLTGGWLLGIVSVLAVSGVVPLYDRTEVTTLTSSDETTTPSLRGRLAAGWEIERVGTVTSAMTDAQSSVYVLRRPRFRL